MKATDMKLGDYRDGWRAVWVPVKSENEDPRPKLAGKPEPKPSKRRPPVRYTGASREGEE